MHSTASSRAPLAPLARPVALKTWARSYLNRIGWSMNHHGLEQMLACPRGTSRNSIDPLIIVSSHWTTPTAGLFGTSTSGNPCPKFGQLCGLSIFWLCQLAYDLDFHIFTSTRATRFVPSFFGFVRPAASRGQSVHKLTSLLQRGRVRRLVMFGKTDERDQREEWSRGFYELLCNTGAALGFLYLDYDKQEVVFQLCASSEQMHRRLEITKNWPAFARWMALQSKRVMCQPCTHIQFISSFDEKQQKLAFHLLHRRHPGDLDTNHSQEGDEFDILQGTGGSVQKTLAIDAFFFVTTVLLLGLLVLGFVMPKQTSHGRYCVLALS